MRYVRLQIGDNYTPDEIIRYWRQILQRVGIREELEIIVEEYNDAGLLVARYTESD